MSLEKIHSSHKIKGHLLGQGPGFLLTRLVLNLAVACEDYYHTHFTEEVAEAQKITQLAKVIQIRKI